MALISALVPAPIRRLVPMPLKQLPWRVGFVARTEAFRRRPIRTLARVAQWSARELTSSSLALRTPEGFDAVTMPNNIGCFMVYATGGFEDELHAFVGRRLRPGGVFCDVGANIGRYTMQAAACVGPTGRVVAFEAHPLTFGFLRRNVDATGLPGITAINAAVGRKAGEISMVFEPGDAGSTHVADGGPSRAGARAVTVPMVKLDDALGEAGIDRVDYLKIDVEGYELPVLQGARAVLERSPGIAVQTEIDVRHLRRFGQTPADIVGFMLPLGLRPHVVEHDGRLTAIEPARIDYGDFIWTRD